MAGFLYFIPNCETLPPAVVAELGLEHALPKGQHDPSPVTRGPDGSPGLIVAAKASVPSLGYHPESQTWQQAPGKRWWLGTINGLEPGPEDLQHPAIVDSLPVELVDGHHWLLPIARQFHEPAHWGEGIPFSVALPQALNLQQDGSWQSSSVIPRYAALWQLAVDWSEVRQGQADQRQVDRFTMDGQVDAAIACLAINYRIGKAEASRLGMLTIELCRRILDTLIDIERFVALAKKKQAALSSANGSPGPVG